MERPGERLKRVREKLGLTYRDVERSSQQIAEHRGNDEFIIALSRLARHRKQGHHSIDSSECTPCVRCTAWKSARS